MRSSARVATVVPLAWAVCAAGPALAGFSPYGFLDTAGDTNASLISGWARDDDYDGPIPIHIYVDGALVKATTAGSYREDVGAHAYGWAPPPYGPGPHSVIVYGIGVDAAGVPDGDNVGLTNSPQSFDAGCDGMVPPERDWCEGNPGYWVSRQSDTAVLGNDLVRAGVDTSYGGTLFQLYASGWDRNLLAEHGGAAVQLSLWGYEAVGSEGWFRQESCDPTGYVDAASCAATGDTCSLYCCAGGAHVTDCVTSLPCLTWTAGAPWNPIQAQAAGCAWDDPSNDVTWSGWVGAAFASGQEEPWQFTKTDAVPGLVWSQVAGAGNTWIQVNYRVTYAGPYSWTPHPQEIPAVFTAPGISDHFYYYGGDTPFADPWAPVERVEAAEGGYLRYPGRPAYGHDTSVVGEVTEGWWTACDASESSCVTVAAFDSLFVEGNLVRLADGTGYLTPLGYFGLEPGLDVSFDVYLFPYKPDAAPDGVSIRERIFDLAATQGCTAESCNGVDDDCDGGADEDFAVDGDGDGVIDCRDLCPAVPDPGQEDADGDGVGDACEAGSDDDTPYDDDATVPADDDTSASDDDTLPDDDATVADDDTTASDDDTVPDDDTTVPGDDTTASDDDTVPDDDTDLSDDDATSPDPPSAGEWTGGQGCTGCMAAPQGPRPAAPAAPALTLWLLSVTLRRRLGVSHLGT